MKFPRPPHSRPSVQNISMLDLAPRPVSYVSMFGLLLWPPSMFGLLLWPVPMFGLLLWPVPMFGLFLRHVSMFGLLL